MTGLDALNRVLCGPTNVALPWSTLRLPDSPTTDILTMSNTDPIFSVVPAGHMVLWYRQHSRHFHSASEPVR